MTTAIGPGNDPAPCIVERQALPYRPAKNVAVPKSAMAETLLPVRRDARRGFVLGASLRMEISATRHKSYDPSFVRPSHTQILDTTVAGEGSAVVGHWARLRDRGVPSIILSRGTGEAGDPDPGGPGDNDATNYREGQRPALTRAADFGQAADCRKPGDPCRNGVEAGDEQSQPDGLHLGEDDLADEKREDTGEHADDDRDHGAGVGGVEMHADRQGDDERQRVDREVEHHKDEKSQSDDAQKC